MSLVKKITSICILSGLLITALFLVYTPTFASLYGRNTYGTCYYGTGCTITISTSGTVSLSANPSGGAVYSIAEDEVEVTTNSYAGYSLSLEMDSATVNALTATGGTIPTGSGTAASPVVLSGNQWGFRVDGEAGFGLGPTTAVTNQSSSSLTFAGIPLLGSPVTVKSTSTDAPTGDITSFWYGIRTDSSQTAGSYTGTVLYTAVSLE